MCKVFAWLLLAALPSFALYESDAGKVDWHKKLIGIPRIEAAAVAPKFERTPGTINARSFIVTASKSNVLAALNAVDGVITWRHVLDPLDLIGVYRSNPGSVITLSGPGGANLRSYEASTGQLLFESRLHKPEHGQLLEPPNIGQDLAFSVDETSDIFTLTNAHSIRRVDSQTGEIKWEWTSEDQSSSILLSKIVSTPHVTFVIGLTKSFKSYTLHIISLDASQGTILSSVEVLSDITGPNDFVVLTSSRTSQPILAWLEAGYIKTVTLTPEPKFKPYTNREDIYKELKDVGISDAGILIAFKRDETAHVIRVDPDTQTVKRAWEFANSASSSDQSESVYTGGLDKAGQPYVARIYWSRVMRASSLQLFAANGAQGKGMMTGFTFPFDPITHGFIQHFALEVAQPQEYLFVARFMLTTSTGALQLWQQEKVHWTREESLAEIKTVEFVDLPEKKVVDGALDTSGFIGRIVRQIYDARNFPSYATQFGRRFLTGSASTERATIKVAGSPLWRDTFGFRKLLVAGTSTGKVFGIDTAHGNIVWSRLLVEGSNSGTIQPFKLFITITTSDGKEPEVVLLAHCESSLNTKSVISYHFEALTGLNIRGDTRSRDILTGSEMFRGRIADAYLLRGENRVVVVVGDDLKVRLYPNDPLTHTFFANISNPVHFAMKSITPSHQHFTGYQIHPAGDGTFQALATWTASLDPTERIQTIIHRPHEPVAALGKVLGDRRTLYKYLNPNLAVVLTASRNSPPACSVYLVDAVKGTVLYHAVTPSVGQTCETKATLTENWLVYHYYDEGLQALDGAKGYRIVSVEFYEGTGIDDKTRSSDLTSYSYDSTLVTVFQQSFVFPYDITSLATTSTKFGISAKELLVANVKHQIQSFPRRFLDPCRPKRKPTAQEQEEWLIQYDPLIPDDPQRILSHNYKVAGIQRFVTSPALLESTSIILAYGLDLFVTRVAPSNTFDILSESFNKFQLVLTVVALGVAVAITKPLVRRKQLKQRWYYS